jgi:hypothetical protein
MASAVVAGKSPGHDDDGGPVDHGLGVGGGALVVAGQAAVAHQPAEGALHDPAAAEYLEAVRDGAGDDLGRDRGDGPGVLFEGLAVVAGVGPHEPQRGERVEQLDEQELRVRLVADVRGGHDQGRYGTRVKL